MVIIENDNRKNALCGENSTCGGAWCDEELLVVRVVMRLSTPSGAFTFRLVLIKKGFKKSLF
jgi:hypothetical protein